MERLLRHPKGFLAVTGLNLVIAREWNDRGDLSIALSSRPEGEIFPISTFPIVTQN